MINVLGGVLVYLSVNGFGVIDGLAFDIDLIFNKSLLINHQVYSSFPSPVFLPYTE